MDPLLAAQDSTPHLHRTHRQQSNKQTNKPKPKCVRRRTTTTTRKTNVVQSFHGGLVVVIVVVFELLFLFFELLCLCLLLPLSLLLHPTYIHLYNLVQFFSFLLPTKLPAVIALHDDGTDINLQELRDRSIDPSITVLVWVR